MQQDHYYPFGMRLAGLSEDADNDNKFLYNSKEMEDYQDLQWYHYGARYYDPQLGGWLQVDPVDEFYSPYVYFGNNPILFVDPDGCLTDITIDENNMVTGMNADGYGGNDPNVYINGELAGAEPPIDANLYETTKDGNYVIVAVEHHLLGNWDNELDSIQKDAWIFPMGLNEKKWNTEGEYDFKSHHKNEIGIAYGL